VENLGKLQRNSDVHNLNKRQRYDLHMPTSNLNKYQKAEYYTVIMLVNNLPTTIISLNHGIISYLTPITLLMNLHSIENS
jgi:hypothetical protein